MPEVIDHVVSFTVSLEPIPGEGRVVNVDRPLLIRHGEVYSIDASIQNIGGSTGSFAIEMYINGNLRYRSATVSLAAGAISADVIQDQSPTSETSSGTSAAFVLKCIRIS